MFLLTVAVSMNLTADKEAAYSHRSHFRSDEGHRGHFHSDFTMRQYLKNKANVLDLSQDSSRKNMIIMN